MSTGIGLPERYAISGTIGLSRRQERYFEQNWTSDLTRALPRQEYICNRLRAARCTWTCRFRKEPALNLLVPDVMNESYTDRGAGHEIEAHAQYLNFRRFGSDVRLGGAADAITTGDGEDLKRESEDTYAVKVDVKVVNVEAWVTGSSGGAVTDLKIDDFNLLENNAPQSISNFSPVSTPYDVLLLFDQSGSARSDWKTMQKAAEGFIASARPQDHVGIAVFNSSFRMLTRWDYTREQFEKDG